MRASNRGNSKPVLDLFAGTTPRAIIKEHDNGKWSWLSVDEWTPPRGGESKIYRITNLDSQAEAIVSAMAFFEKHAGDNRKAMEFKPHDPKIQPRPKPKKVTFVKSQSIEKDLTFMKLENIELRIAQIRAKGELSVKEITELITLAEAMAEILTTLGCNIWSQETSKSRYSPVAPSPIAS
jgi:hypothetical protein